MTRNIRNVEAGISPAGNTERAGSGGTAATGVSRTHQAERLPIKETYSVALTVDVTAGDDFGYAKIIDLPDSNLILKGAEVDLVLTKGGGLTTSTDIKFAFGTSALDSTTIAGAHMDVLDSVSLTANTVSHDVEKHSNENSSPALLFADDAAGLALYANVQGSCTTDGTVTITGYVDIYYDDIGNRNS